MFTIAINYHSPNLEVLENQSSIPKIGDPGDYPVKIKLAKAAKGHRKMPYGKRRNPLAYRP